MAAPWAAVQTALQAGTKTAKARRRVNHVEKIVIQAKYVRLQMHSAKSVKLTAQQVASREPRRNLSACAVATSTIKRLAVSVKHVRLEQTARQKMGRP